MMCISNGAKLSSEGRVDNSPVDPDHQHHHGRLRHGWEEAPQRPDDPVQQAGETSDERVRASDPHFWSDSATNHRRGEL